MIYLLTGLMLGIVIGSLFEKWLQARSPRIEVPQMTLYDEVSGPAIQQVVRDPSGKRRIIEIVDPNPNTPGYDRR